MTELMGNLIMIMAPIIFYFFVFMCMKEVNIYRYIKSVGKNEWCIAFAILAIMTMLIAALVVQNEFIYYWDYGREWKTAYSIINDFEVSVVGTLKNIYASINAEDYNRLMPLLIAFPLKIMGSSFNVYVIINHILYMCPAVLLFSLFAYAVLEKNSKKAIGFWQIVLVSSATPILYYVELDGFMDPPVLILIVCVLFLSLEFDYRNFSLHRTMLIATALLMLVLFRRHFAYWVVGYIVSQFVNFVFQVVMEKKDFKERKKIVIGYLQNMFFIGGVCILILIVFFRGFLLQSVFNNFSVAYKAYDVPLEGKLKRVVEVFGFGTIFIAGLIPLVKSIKDIKIRKLYWVYISNITVTTVLLWRILQMNYHQYYLIVLQVILLLLLGINILYEKFKTLWLKIAITVYCVLNIFLFIKPIPGIEPINFIFTQRNYEIKYRSDIHEIKNLVKKINELSQDNKGVYVLSSSGTLNSHTLLYALMPETDRAINNLYGTHNVDLRDGFPTAFFNADIIVVGKPVQLHLPDDTQRVISYLATELVDSNSYIGKHYEWVSDYQLEGEVTASVYLKRSELEKTDYEELRNYYDQFYADYPEYFSERIVYPEPYFPTQTGEFCVLHIGEGELISDWVDGISDKQGTLVYGPAKKIQRGEYNVKFEYEYEGNENVIGTVDVYVGGNAWAQQEVYGDKTEVVIENVVIDSDYKDAQFRMFVNCEGVKFVRMTVTRK